MSLNIPAVSLVAIGEVAQSRCLVLEGIQQPVQNNFTKSSTVRVAKCTTMSDVDVTLPRGGTSW